jgi:hypothetical protein
MFKIFINHLQGISGTSKNQEQLCCSSYVQVSVYKLFTILSPSPKKFPFRSHPELTYPVYFTKISILILSCNPHFSTPTETFDVILYKSLFSLYYNYCGLLHLITKRVFDELQKNKIIVVDTAALNCDA